MDMNDYQNRTNKTVVYPPGELGKHYVIIALCGEVGELANLFKKYLRGDFDNLPSDVFRSKLEGELGDILWYLAQAAEIFDMRLNDVAKFNLEKLAHRKVLGTLKAGADRP